MIERIMDWLLVAWVLIIAFFILWNMIDFTFPELSSLIKKRILKALKDD